MRRRTPSAEEITSVIEVWNALVAEAGKGCAADPKAARIRVVAAKLWRISPGRETFQTRGRCLLRERFRESAYTTLRSLYQSWDSLGQKTAKQPIYGGSGQPQTALSTIKAIWQTPKPPPAAYAPISAWLSRH